MPEQGQKRCVAGACRPESPTEKNAGFGMSTKVDYGVQRVNARDGEGMRTLSK